MSRSADRQLHGGTGHTLAQSGLSTRAECCASVGWDYAQQYAAAIEADKAADAATALFTSHGYFVAPGSPLKGWAKPVWETESAPFDTGPFDPAWDDGSLLSGFTWAQNIYTGLTKANLSAFLYLWGANTSTTTITGPNTGLVHVKGNAVATSGRLWAFASYSRFVRPGAVRIATTTSDASLEVSAFRNADGSIAVVVLNSAHSRQVATFSLRGLGAAHVTPYLTDTSHDLSAQAPVTVINSAFTATLPPRSLVSYDIRSERRPPAVTSLPRPRSSGPDAAGGASTRLGAGLPVPPRRRRQPPMARLRSTRDCEHAARRCSRCRVGRIPLLRAAYVSTVPLRERGTVTFKPP